MKTLALILSISSFSNYILVITFQSFATLVITGPLRVGLTRYHATALSEGGGVEYRRFAFWTFVVSALITPIFAGALFYSIRFEAGVTIQGVILAILYAILSDYSSFLSSAALQVTRKWLGVWLMLVGKLALLFGAVITYLLSDVSAPETILIFAITLFVLGLLIVREYLFGHCSLSKSFESLRWAERAMPIAKFGAVFVLTGIISWAQMSLPRYYLSWWQSQEDIVKFYLVTQIAMLSMVTLTSAIGQTISPILFRRHDESQLTATSPWGYEVLGGVMVVLSAGVFASLLSMFLGDWLVALVSNKSIKGASILLSLSFATYGFYAIAQILRIYGDQIKRPKIYLSANITYPVAAVLLSYFGVQHGLLYLCLALLASELLHLIMIVSINHIEYSSQRIKA